MGGGKNMGDVRLAIVVGLVILGLGYAMTAWSSGAPCIRTCCDCAPPTTTTTTTIP